MKAVIFDLGSTLFDHGPYPEDLEAVYPHLHQWLLDSGCKGVPDVDHLLDLRSLAQLTARDFYFGADNREIPARQAFRIAMEKLGIDIPDTQVVDKAVEIDHQAFSRSVRVAEGTVATLQALRDMGLRIGLLSNTLDPAELLQADLRAHGLEPLFDDFIYSSSFGRRKPHPSIYRQAAANLGVHPRQCVYVGDRVKEDVLGPQAVGMVGVLTLQLRQEPPAVQEVEHVVRKLAELPDLVTRLAAAA